MVGFNPNATLYCPLSQEEKNFAKAFKIHTKMSEAFQRRMVVERNSDCETEIEQAREAWREEWGEIRALREEHLHLFNSDFWYALHGINFICGFAWEAKMAEQRARTGVGTGFAGLPDGEFSVCGFTNAVTIGMGSRIPMGHFTLHIFDDMVAAFPNHVRNPHEAFANGQNIPSAFLRPLNWLVHASTHGNSSLNTNIADGYSDRQLNADTLAFLQKIGIDTTRDFTINGTAFHVHNGAVQTRGYTPIVNPNRVHIGAEGMQHLLARAYAQNLFGVTRDE